MLELIGRLHPVLLHLPIGIFAFVFFLEIMSRSGRSDEYEKTISLGLLCGMIFAIFSSTTGLLLADGGDYNGDTIFLHKWLGLAFTLLSVLLYYLHSKKRKNPNVKGYFPTFLLMMFVMLLAGHKGGSITHGEGFLMGESVEKLEIENVDKAVAYEEIIAPIFKSKCNSCHNASKAKGKLNMTSQNYLMKGGKNGVVIVPGDVKESSLLARIHLPKDEKEHMPPKSKKQLTEDETLLIEWWISEGASFNKTVEELKPNDKISEILKKYSRPKEASLASKIKPPDESDLKELNDEGIEANLVAAESPLVEIHLAHRQDLSTSLLKKIRSVDEQITYVNLSHSNADDGMLSVIQKLPHLQNLQLQETQISDKGLKQLEELDYLETLNLYGTDVGDEILDLILSLPSLKTVYLWKTKVTDEVVTAIQKERPLLKVNHKINTDIFGDASLKPPIIVAEKDLFSDSISVEIVQNFKGVKIYYTLDGSEPDSLSSIYETPIKLTKTSLVKARSGKVNWGISDVVEKRLIKTKFSIKSISLDEKPSQKYAANGPSALTDYEKGTTVFTTGEWLGFEKNDLVATLDLGEIVNVNSVTVSALESTGSWIFHPRGMTIWTSIDGNHYKKQKSVNYPVVEASEPPSTHNFLERIDSTDARFVKIEVKRNPKNPPWHPNPGGNSWLFVDEILVD